jgi:hypothetical protein
MCGKSARNTKQIARGASAVRVPTRLLLKDSTSEMEDARPEMPEMEDARPIPQLARRVQDLEENFRGFEG